MKMLCQFSGYVLVLLRLSSHLRFDFLMGLTGEVFQVTSSFNGHLRDTGTIVFCVVVDYVLEKPQKNLDAMPYEMVVSFGVDFAFWQYICNGRITIEYSSLFAGIFPCEHRLSRFCQHTT